MKQTILSFFLLSAIATTAQVIDVVTSGLSEPAGLAIMGNSLYIAQAGSNKISMIDISSSSPTITDLVTGVTEPDGLVLNGNILYIAEYGADKISKVDLTAATPILTTVITNVLEPTGIAINGEYLYIAEYNAGKISKLNLTTLLKTDYINNIVGPTGLSINDNILYFSDFNENTISKVDLTATVPVVTQVVAGFNEPAFINVIGSELYVAEYGSGKISKVNTSNSTVSDVTTNLLGVYGLVDNGSYLFLSQSDSNKISKIALPTLATANIDLKNSISIYPNPTSSYLTIKNVLANSTISIADVNGKIIDQFNYQNPTIDLRNLAKGIYFLTINKNKTIKFIKN